MAMPPNHPRVRLNPVNVPGVTIGPGKSVLGTTAPEMTVQGKIAATVRAFATARTAGVMIAPGKIVRPAKIAATALGMTGPGMSGPGKNDPGMIALARTARPGKTGRGVIALKAVAGIAGGNANPVRTALNAIPWL
jgi:hypothetical protein